MALNIGNITASRENDELYTPYYCVEALLKYIPKKYKIWCPFDKDWSSFVQVFKRAGYDVIYSHIDYGQDFFSYEPEDYDIIISNPPFSVKDKVLERLYSLHKPFAILLPTNSLQGKFRCNLFNEYGVELINFNIRIGFHSPTLINKNAASPPFGSSFFCHNVLPHNTMTFEIISPYQKDLIHENLIEPYVQPENLASKSENILVEKLCVYSKENPPEKLVELVL